MRRALAAGLALVALAGCGGGDRAAVVTTSTTAPATATTVTPTTVTPTTVTPTTVGVRPEGFDRTSITLTRVDGTVLAWCVWLAATEAQRQRGLMEVTDLGGAEGMLFRFAAPTEGRFYMLRTRLPLTIGHFGIDGELVSVVDMPPCPDDDDEPACPRYAAAGPFVDALEVPLGALAAAGVGPGTVLAVPGSPC